MASEIGQFDLAKLKIQRDANTGGGGNRSGRRVTLIIVAALVLGLLTFIFLRSSLDSGELVDVTTVSLVTPSRAQAIMTASGYVVAQRKASIASKATGRIVYLGFREGDQVTEGQIIARIESADVEAALKQAEADLNVAHADQNDAEQTLNRSRTLLKRELISQAEFDAAQARYDRVVATIASREAAVRAARVQLENTRIRAPFDGTILTKNADIGEVVAPFAAGASSRVAVVTIADMSSLEVEADVAESNIAQIGVGQPCEITLDAYPEAQYRGVVDKIVPTADRAKATVLTKIRFLERDNRVLPEMSAKAHFLPKEKPLSSDDRPRLTVDPAAIVTRDAGKIVFRLNGGSVEAVPVTLGEPLGRLVEVAAGLSPGDRVVLKPSGNLRSGSKVRLAQKQAG